MLINPFRHNTSTDKKLYVNLNIKVSDSLSLLADGVLARFGADYTYTNGDDNDVQKQSNIYENLGISSHNDNLIMEARPEIHYHRHPATKTLECSKENISATIEG